MNILGALEIIWSTFANNKTRTFLTIFGVSIGMGAIVFLVSLGYGLQRLTIDRISSSMALTTYSLSSGNSQIIKLNENMAKNIENMSEVKRIGRSYALSGHLFYEKSETDVTVYATDNNYLELEDLNLAAGAEYRDPQSTNSIMLSSSATKVLGFATPAEAIGKEIETTVYYSNDDLSKSEKIKLKVIGVTNEDSSNIIYLPIGIIKVPSGIDYSIIKAEINKAENYSVARSKFESMGLKVYSVAETINSMNEVFKIIQWVLFGFGLIALVVASLGMFNTMTISLLERVRDIGIMKALGATSNGVYKIFLMEAVILGISGGVLGALGGWLLGVFLNLALSNLAVRLGGDAITVFYTPLNFVLIVLVFSTIVGFLTGFYPARRASRLNALESLRYE